MWLLGGCSDDDRAPGVPPGPVARFTVASDYLDWDAVPFPNDVFRVGDEDGVETIEVLGLERVVPQFPEVFRQGLRSLDGFGLSTALFFPIEGDLLTESLPPTPADSVAEGSTLFLVVAKRGDGEVERHPVEWSWDPETRILSVLPEAGHPLRPGTTYVAVLTTGVQGVDPATGAIGPLAPSFHFRNVRDAERETEAVAGPLRRAASRYEDPLEVVVGLPDVDRPAIAVASVFTTQTATRDLTRIRQELEREPAPRMRYDDPVVARTYDTPALLDDLLGVAESERPGFGNPGGVAHASIRAVLSGTFDSTWYKSPDVGIPVRIASSIHDDDRFVRDADGNPILQAIVDVPVTFVVPAAAPPPAGYPVAIFQHGLGGQRSAVFGLASSLCAGGYLVVAIDAPEHGFRYAGSSDEVHNVTGEPGPDGFAEVDSLQQAVGVFEAFLSIPAIRDNFRQTVVDLMNLVRLLQSPDLDLSPVGDPPVDASHIVFVGNSFGSLTGAVLLATEPDVPTGVLNVGGAGLVTYILINSPFIGGDNIPTIATLFGTELEGPLSRFEPFTNLAQTILDPADPTSYARNLVDEPLPIRGLGTPLPKNVLQIEAMGDEVVPNSGNEYLARALRLDQVVPAARPVTGLAEVPGPLVHNRVVNGVAVTAGLIQQNPAAHGANLTSQRSFLGFQPGFPHPGADPFPLREERTEVTHDLEAFHAGILRFLDTARAGAAEIVVPLPPEPFPPSDAASLSRAAP